MKISIFVIATLLYVVMILLVTGCSDRNKLVIDEATFSSEIENDLGHDVQDDNESYCEDDYQEEVFDSPVDLVSFSNLEDFNSYLKKAEKGGDVADLASLKKYYLPTRIPEEYKLYKITAGVEDIGFWYLPKSYLDSEDSIFRGEASQKHYLFICTRNGDMEGVKQFELESSDLIDNKYYLYNASTDILFWEQDGNLLMLYLPVGIASKLVNNESISELCKSQAVMVD